MMKAKVGLQKEEARERRVLGGGGKKRKGEYGSTVREKAIECVWNYYAISYFINPGNQ